MAEETAATTEWSLDEAVKHRKNVRVRESLACPDCGEHAVDIVQGREFLIDNIEVVSSRA